MGGTRELSEKQQTSVKTKRSDFQWNIDRKVTMIWKIRKK